MESDTPTTELAEAYAHSTHDALRPRDLLADEVAQRRESGYDVNDFVAAANETDPDDREAVLSLVDGMTLAVRSAGWRYEEPEALVDIRAAAGDSSDRTPVREEVYGDQVHAGWLGRVAGCNLGKPVEQGAHWTVEHLADYLRRADAYPLTDYIPVLDPMPDGFELRENWPETTRGRVNGSARDDDIDYAILALHLLEQHGRELRPQHVGDAWLSLFPVTQIFTAERAAYVNLVDGVPVPTTARVRNPYREWIGAQIRGDVFGYVNPGNPWAAAELAYQDATLSHTGNGVYGEMWAAALVSAAFVSESAIEAFERSIQVLPRRSRLWEALRHVQQLHSEGRSWEEAVDAVHDAYGHYSWVHTINNAALVAVSLLWSDDDFTTAVGRTVMGGWDTDSNGATVGSVMGVLTGTKRLPAHFIDPLQDRTRSALFGFDHSRLSDLAERTVRLGVSYR